MIVLPAKAAGYRISRATGFTFLLPVTLAVSVTHRCNSRCATCRVYHKKRDELSVSEYDRIFKSLSGALNWITITGGEPFIREDLPDIIDSAVKRTGPNAITVASNGWYTDRIVSFVQQYIKKHKDTRLVINLSLDGIGPAHDRVRGLKGSFDRVRETFFALKDLRKGDEFHLGINTVISKFNIGAIPDLITYMSNFEPDSHIFEPAQRRAELNVQEADIGADIDELEKVLEHVMGTRSKPKKEMVAELIYYFRRYYYKLSLKTLKNKEQVIPCYAGVISAHISPGGKVWPCCTLASSMGHLRDVDYDFGKLWESKEASKIRKSIRQKRCYCVLANAAYSNIFMDTPSVLKIVSEYAKKD